MASGLHCVQYPVAPPSPKRGSSAQAVREYRAHLPGPHTRGILTDEVLRSLMHVNFVRACGIDFDDEAIGLYLARSAALSWTARTTGEYR